MVEISLDDHKNSKSSAPLLVVYSVITCLLVGVHLLALMISTCILPQLEADSLLGYEQYASHETLYIYIELAWILSTGLGSFALEVRLDHFSSRFVRHFSLLGGNRHCLLGEILLRHRCFGDRHDDCRRSVDSSLLDLFAALLSTTRLV